MMNGGTNRRGNTADALNQAKMSVEERKENRILMGQVLLNSQKQSGGRFQQAAAAVLGSGKPPAHLNSHNTTTDDRRITMGGGGAGASGLPPSGYRGQSLSYPRGGTGGPIGSNNFNSDPFSVGYQN